MAGSSGRRMLVVDDEKNMRELLSDVFNGEGYDVVACVDGASALAAGQTQLFDVILLDLRLPDMPGLQVLKELRRRQVATSVLVITAFGTIDTAVNAMQQGACDFLVKPFDDLDRVKSAVAKAQEARSLISIASRSRPTVGRDAMRRIVGDSPKLTEVMEIVEKVARSNATVLIRGESGTGKELVAQAIHYNSARRDHAFVPMNCASLPETLLESELFGHERGSFTGAYSRKTGRLEVAHEGTLFLDEVGDMSPAMQAKLLRVLEQMRFTRVGGTEPVDVDVRTIAATNQDMEKAVAEGKFREDLYYRLNVIPISLPPLRERKDDVRTLVDYFIERHCRANALEPIRFSEETMQLLVDYDWPGNIRELQNSVEKGVVLGEQYLFMGRQRVGAAGPPAKAVSLREATDEAQRRAILRALQETRGNKAEAAKLLGIGYKTLFNKLNELGIGRSATGE